MEELVKGLNCTCVNCGEFITKGYPVWMPDRGEKSAYSCGCSERRKKQTRGGEGSANYISIFEITTFDAPKNVKSKLGEGSRNYGFAHSAIRRRKSDDVVADKWTFKGQGCFSLSAKLRGISKLHERNGQCFKFVTYKVSFDEGKTWKTIKFDWTDHKDALERMMALANKDSECK